ncbi:MAG: radical SAM protein [Actinobacteria bacterium]|nr:radical SAM protein [Actinomycetota bacterium]
MIELPMAGAAKGQQGAGCRAGAKRTDCGAGAGGDGGVIAERAAALQAEMTERLRAVRARRALPTPYVERPQVDVDLDSAASLPLVAPLAHRRVDGAHLWVAVEQGAVLVFDDADDARFRQLAQGASPRAIASRELGRTADGDDVARHLGDLLGRIASAGFLTSTSGLHGSRVPTPHRFARLHLTKACQLQCVHCYADSSPTVDRSGERPLAWWRALLDELAEVGTERVLFTGGEALVHRGCLGLMEHAKTLGLHVTLFTNGIKVPKLIDRIAASCDQVQVSLDGPSPEINDPIRGKASYSRAVRALDALLETDVQVRVGITSMASNWEAWREQFARFAERFAHTDLEYKMSFGITEHGRAEGIGEQLDPEAAKAQVERLLSGRRGSQLGPRVTRRTTGCGYFEQIVVGPDGTLYPCHLLDAPLGNADDKPLGAWVEELTHLATLFSVDYTDGCASCDIRYLCGGTCRVMNAKRTGSRLITTCTDADKQRRYRNLVKYYAADARPSGAVALPVHHE